ncbi:MAG: hypothetical protein JO307_29005 [Bryobacterales bacterium]|nr:hypothetical protein [Bryobacterales bacterium]
MRFQDLGGGSGDFAPPPARLRVPIRFGFFGLVGQPRNRRRSLHSDVFGRHASNLSIIGRWTDHSSTKGSLFSPLNNVQKRLGDPMRQRKAGRAIAPGGVDALPPLLNRA